MASPPWPVLAGGIAATLQVMRLSVDVVVSVNDATQETIKKNNDDEGDDETLSEHHSTLDDASRQGRRQQEEEGRRHHSMQSDTNNAPPEEEASSWEHFFLPQVSQNSNGWNQGRWRPNDAPHGRRRRRMSDDNNDDDEVECDNRLRFVVGRTSLVVHLLLAPFFLLVAVRAIGVAPPDGTRRGFLVSAAVTTTAGLLVSFRDSKRWHFGTLQRMLHLAAAVLLWLGSFGETPEEGGPPMLLMGALSLYAIVAVWEVRTCPGTFQKGAAAAHHWGTLIRMLQPYFWPRATSSSSSSSSSATMNRIRAMATWACVLGSRGLNLASPLFLGRASTALAQRDYGTAVWYSIAYAAVSLVSNALREAQGLLYLRVAQDAFVQLAELSFAHVHSLSLDWHMTKKLGQVIRSVDRGIAACDSLLKLLFLRLVPLVAEIGVVTILFATYFHHLLLSLSVLVFVYLYFWATLVITLWRRQFRDQVRQSDNEWHDRCTDSLVNFEMVKCFTAETLEMERFGKAVQSFKAGSVAVSASMSFLNLVQTFLLQACLATALTLTALDIEQRHECCRQQQQDCVGDADPCCPPTCVGMQAGDFVTVLVYTLKIFVPLSGLGSIYNAIVMAAIDLSNLLEILAEHVTVADGAMNLPPQNAQEPETVVEFDNVYFSYPSQPRHLGLQGLTFTLKKGTVTAIVGSTGAGKTTVSKLLLRFYDVSEGSIKVHGVDVREVTQQSLREAVGVVPQTAALFNDTIRHNVLYGKRHATDEEVRAALRAAQLESLVESLPDGWDTRVGDRGLKLSGGELQRTAIARCWLKDPPIVLLDEATSALDAQTERSIQDALDQFWRQRGRTCLVIAHRLGSIRHAHQILVLQDGQVAERGTHDELLAQNGAYAQLWNMQLHQTDH